MDFLVGAVHYSGHAAMPISLSNEPAVWPLALIRREMDPPSKEAPEIRKVTV